MPPSLPDDDPSVCAIADAVGAGAADRFGAVRSAMDTIRRRDLDVRAWTHLGRTDHALGGKPRPDGALQGVPFGVKDVIDVAGMPTRCGSTACGDEPAAFDAACVALLRDAGAVPVGKTVTAEFAFVTPGPTRNPRHLAHTPGGSSSGSAAAVAAGMVPLALGTQTGGSMIRPAAFCGVVGFKPTHGLVPRAGLRLLSESLDVVGWFTSSVDDALRVARVLLPSTSDERECVRHLPAVSLMSADPCHVLEPSAADCLDAARAGLEGQGVLFHAATIAPETATSLLDAHAAILRHEAARNLLGIASARPDALSKPLLQLVDAGLHLDGDTYRQARAMQRAWRGSWERVCGESAILMTSSALGPAPEGLGSTGASAFNKAWSLLGWPCVHLPIDSTADGLPLGVQLIGPPGSDLALLRAAASIHPLIDRRPRVDR